MSNKNTSYEHAAFPWTRFCATLGLGAVIFGVIIGVLVQQTKDIPMPTPAPSPDNTTMANSTSSTPADLASCNKTMMDFPSSKIDLVMAVSSSISSLEIDYAKNVFAKTYGALVKNQLEQAQTNFCDPFCRTITATTVVNSAITAAAAAQAKQGDTTNGSCDSQLQLTLSVDGTYWGCEDTVFPGLFTISDQARYLRTAAARSGFSPRALQEGETCPVCTGDAASLEFSAPSVDQLKEAMQTYVTVLPGICELTSAAATIAP
jgi:hypothetical protein